MMLKVIAATVASDPTKYSEAFLGKPNEEYCAWILDSEKWGGVLNFFSLLFRACFGVPLIDFLKTILSFIMTI